MKEIIQKVIDHKHELPQDLVSRLDADAVKEMTTLLRQKKAGDPTTPFLVNALARVAPAVLLPELPKLLGKSEADTLTAVAYMGRIGSVKEEKPLLETLGKQTALVQQKTALALGKIGSKEALAPLMQLVGAKNIEQASVRLGAFLLASRLKLPWKDVQKADFTSKPATVLPAAGKTPALKTAAASAETVKKALQNLRDPFGMQFTEKDALSYTCGNREQLLVYNKAVPAAALKDKTDTLQCPAAILAKSPVDESWSVQYLVFLLPDAKEGKIVHVLRTDGYRLMQGTLRNGKLTLSSVAEKPVAAMTVEASITDKPGQLTIVSEQVVRNKLAPVPMKLTEMKRG